MQVTRYYVNNRDKYKTLSDFYPELAKCLNDYVMGHIIIH